ncbi:MAG: hypothetical protein FD142_3167, partial [bacterium]
GTGGPREGAGESGSVDSGSAESPTSGRRVHRTKRPVLCDFADIPEEFVARIRHEAATRARMEAEQEAQFIRDQDNLAAQRLQREREAAAEYEQEQSDLLRRQLVAERERRKELEDRERVWMRQQSRTTTYVDTLRDAGTRAPERRAPFQSESYDDALGITAARARQDLERVRFVADPAREPPQKVAQPPILSRGQATGTSSNYGRSYPNVPIVLGMAMRTATVAQPVRASPTHSPMQAPAPSPSRVRQPTSPARNQPVQQPSATSARPQQDPLFVTTGVSPIYGSEGATSGRRVQMVTGAIDDDGDNDRPTRGRPSSRGRPKSSGKYQSRSHSHTHSTPMEKHKSRSPSKSKSRHKSKSPHGKRTPTKKPHPFDTSSSAEEPSPNQCRRVDTCYVFGREPGAAVNRGKVHAGGGGGSSGSDGDGDRGHTPRRPNRTPSRHSPPRGHGGSGSRHGGGHGHGGGGGDGSSPSSSDSSNGSSGSSSSSSSSEGSPQFNVTREDIRELQRLSRRQSPTDSSEEFSPPHPDPHDHHKRHRGHGRSQSNVVIN